MRNNSDPKRFEKEMTDEPNMASEQSPAMGTNQTGWDSLRDVPFAGDKSTMSHESQEQEEDFEQEM